MNELLEFPLFILNNLQLFHSIKTKNVSSSTLAKGAIFDRKLQYFNPISTDFVPLEQTWFYKLHINKKIYCIQIKYKCKTSLQVIKINGDQYDLRFFGGTHERITVEKAYIRPISININSLQVTNNMLLVLSIICLQ